MNAKMVNLVLGVSALLSYAAPTLASENRANRENKSAYAAWEVIGLTMVPVGGLRAGYFFTPELAGEMSYAASTAKIGDFESKKSIIEGKAKYFIGDSFYADGGLTYETFDVKYSVYKFGTSVDRESLKANVSNVGINTHIGNQWQWPGFTLGCDWIGYFLSLSTKSKFSKADNLDESNEKKQQDSIKTAMGGSSLHLMRFYLGWSF
jgi:hypothetical protein